MPKKTVLDLCRPTAIDTGSATADTPPGSDLARGTVLVATSSLGATALVLYSLHRALSEFTGDLPQHDDLTVVRVKTRR